MLIGTHDGDLITNQDAVGKTLTEVTGTNYITLEFINYLGEKMQPIEIVAEIETNTYGKQTATIKQTPTTIIIGHRENGAVRATTYIENGQLNSNYEGSNGRTIDEIGTIKILTLTTTEREYTEFQFD